MRLRSGCSNLGLSHASTGMSPAKGSTEFAMTQESKPQVDSIPKAPKEGTEAARAYFLAAESDFRFFDFIVDIALRSDYVAFVLQQALDGKAEYKSVAPSELAKTQPGSVTKF